MHLKSCVIKRITKDVPLSTALCRNCEKGEQMEYALIKRIVICVSIFLIPNAAFSQSCFESIITSPTPFMGNNGEIFKLADGTIAEVVAEYEYLYEYYPSVTICPDRSVLIVNGKKLNIQLVSNSETSSYKEKSRNASHVKTPSVIESKINGEFEGYKHGNIYKLRNGQIWEQVSSKYRYKYNYAPDVIIINRDGTYHLQVEGMED